MLIRVVVKGKDAQLKKDLNCFTGFRNCNYFTMREIKKQKHNFKYFSYNEKFIFSAIQSVFCELESKAVSC